MNLYTVGVYFAPIIVHIQSNDDCNTNPYRISSKSGGIMPRSIAGLLSSGKERKYT